LRAVRWRFQRTVVLAVATGIVVGLAVALFEYVAAGMVLERILDARLAVQMAAPGVGLLLATLALRWFARRASPSTADEYVNYFHDRRRALPLWPVPGRLAAAAATLGLGGALGFEGPSIYLGAATGSAMQQRFQGWFGREETRVLMVAGAAAGVAAVFRAPVTGAVFALEVPYRHDLAARAVLPALMGAASSYLAFVAVRGTDPLLGVFGHPTFSTADLAGAVAVGLLCGVGARGFAAVVGWAKRLSRRSRVRVRLPAVGLALLGLAASSYAVFDASLTLGPGYQAITWAADPHEGLPLVALLFAMRFAATGLTLAGGGAGGVFVPLAVQGALVGRFVSGLLNDTQSSLFPLVGMAAFLGAGYRTPIAAIAFVAEVTGGRAGFVIPGLIAAVTADLVMGESSVSGYQQDRRAGHLERRLRLPVTAALVRDAHPVSPQTSLHDLVNVHFVSADARSVPVASDGHYLGMVRGEDVEHVEQLERDAMTVADVMTSLQPAELSWTMRRAVMVMRETGAERLAVVDHGRLVGVVTMTEILRLDDLLDGEDA